jgi:RNA polymerase sigma-70 factor (ECF subfamily)
MSETRVLLSKGLPYIDILRRNAYKYGACADNIEDILQDVFLAAWEKADDIPLDKLQAYLLAISRNTSLNRKRKEQVRHKHEPRLMVEELLQRMAETSDFYSRVLTKPLSVLSDRERKLIDLLYREGLLKYEAAAQLGISPRTVHRWLAKIKEKLSE